FGPLTVNGSSLGFAFNSGPGGSEINDWSFTGLPLLADPIADDLVQVSGTVSVTLAGLFVAGGAVTPTSPSAGADSALSFSLTGVSVFVGVGGTVTGGVVTPGSIGISGSGSIDVAVATFGGVQHVAVVGSALAGSISTGSSALTLSVTAGSLVS